MIAEPARLRARGAPLLSKFGNPSIREILVVTSGHVLRPYRLWGRGRGVPNIPTGEVGGNGECHFFLAGNRAVLLGNRCFSWREIA